MPSQYIWETPRLAGRHLEASDLPAMLQVYGDADAMRWVGDGQPLHEAQCAQWLAVTEQNYRERGYGMSTLLSRSTGEIVGFCGLVHPGGQPDAEIKYALKREFWGLGLATEAVAAMLTYGTQVGGLRKVIATTAPDNIASIRVLLKAGMSAAEPRRNEDGSLTRVFIWLAAQN